MPKNKPKHKKAGARPGAGSQAAEKNKKQQQGAAGGKASNGKASSAKASGGKVVSLKKGGGSAGAARPGVAARMTAGAKATAAKPAASGKTAARTAASGKTTARAGIARQATTRRLRFIPPAAAEGVAKLGAGAVQSWQRMLIALRLSRSASPERDAAASAAARAAAGATANTAAGAEANGTAATNGTAARVAAAAAARQAAATESAASAKGAASIKSAASTRGGESAGSTAGTKAATSAKAAASNKGAASTKGAAGRTPPAAGSASRLKGRPGRGARGRFLKALDDGRGSLANSLSRWRRGLTESPHLKSLFRQAFTFDGMIAVLLAFLIFYPPYFRGLFFEPELLPTHMLTAVIFAFFAFIKLMRKELTFFDRPLDYAVFILLGLYAASNIAPWSIGDAIQGMLKMANYAAIYWLLAYSVRSLSAVRGYLGVLLASGAGVSLLGLGAALGTFKYEGSFDGGRISSSLQYPNTLAAFLTAINLFGLHLWNEHRRNKLLGALLAVANYLLFLAILGSQSRGGLVLYPIGLIILLAGLGRERWRTLGLFGMQLVSALAVIGGVLANSPVIAAGAKPPADYGITQLHGWIWVLSGAVLVCLLHLGWEYYTAWKLQAAAGGRRRRLKPWVAPTAAALAVLVLAAGCYGLWRERPAVAALASKAASVDLVQRLKTISLSDINLQERLAMSRDALKIMTSSPLNALLGAGGGGWNASYHRFQSYLYNSTEVHNHFMQVGVETGFPGLAAFLLIWGFFIATAWRLYRRTRTGGRLKTPAGVPGTAWAIMAGAVALGMHSMMDFNLSLGAVAMMLWGLFGLERGLERLYGPVAEARAAAAETAAAQDRQERRARARYKKKNEPAAWKMPSAIEGVIVGALALVFFFWPMNLLIGVNFAQAGDQAAKNNDVQSAIDNYDKAIRHDYWNSNLRSTIANYYLYDANQESAKQSSAGQSTTDQSSADQEAIYNDIIKANQNASVAVRSNRGSASIRSLYGRGLFQSGSLDEGLAQLEQAVVMDPLDQNVYEYLASGYFQAGSSKLQQAANPQSGSTTDATKLDELKKEGQHYLELGMAVPGRAQARMAAVPARYRDLWDRLKAAPLLEPTATTYQQAGEAATLLGNWQEAEKDLNLAVKDSGIEAETQVWLGMVLQQEGKTAEGQELIDKAVKANSNLTSLELAIKALLPKKQ